MTTHDTPAEPGRRALRIRVLRETLHRLTTTETGDSPTEDLAAATVRRVLTEMLADMTPSPDTDTPTTPAPVDPALVERVARALLTVQLHIGPNAIATAQSGRPIRLSGGEADRAATVALAELAPELAHTPLICSDERHQAKVAALETEVRRLGLMVDEYGAGARALSDKLRDARTALTRVREAALLEGAAAIQAVIDADRAKFPARSNDRTALGGARQIILSLLKPALTGPAEENQP